MKRVIDVRIFVGIDVVMMIVCEWHDGNIVWFMGVKIILLIIAISLETILSFIVCIISVFCLKIHAVLLGITALT